MDISIKCDSLKVIYSVKNGMLRCVAPYEFTISLMPMIKVCIEEVGNRIIRSKSQVCIWCDRNSKKRRWT